MTPAELPENEERRQALLEELAILETGDEQAYDDLTELAAQICGTPIALVSLVDSDRQWFKSKIGLDVPETPRDVAFCSHAILQADVFEVRDATADSRFHDNPLVTGAPNVGYYAGMPLTLEGDLRVGTLCVIDHKRRELNEQQIEALRRLGRQVVTQLELRLRVRQLESLEALKGELIAMVSHELRTPLTSIHGSLSLLQSGALAAKPEKRDTLLRIAHESSGRMSSIVNDILDYSKLQSGHVELVTEPLMINRVIGRALGTMQSYLRQCGVGVNTELDDEAGECDLDEGRVVQILVNLVSNAAKFSPAGSNVTVSSHDDGDGVRISVCDRGPGIPPERYKEIFRRFGNVGSDTDSDLPGTGLGLAITRILVERHGGRIWFESEVGEGTCFHVRLPRASAA